MFPAHMISETGRILKYLVWTDGTRGFGLSSAVLVLDVTLQVMSVLEDFLTVGTLDRFRRFARRVVHAVIYWILRGVVVGHLVIVELLIIIILLHGAKISVAVLHHFSLDVYVQSVVQISGLRLVVVNDDMI